MKPLTLRIKPDGDKVNVITFPARMGYMWQCSKKRIVL